VAWRRPQEIMGSNSLMLIPEGSGKLDIFYHFLKPYEHYIPVRYDLIDLEEKFEWMEKNPEECKRII
jgi:hypothetical protein